MIHQISCCNDDELFSINDSTLQNFSSFMIIKIMMLILSLSLSTCISVMYNVFENIAGRDSYSEESVIFFPKYFCCRIAVLNMHRTKLKK